MIPEGLEIIMIITIAWGCVKMAKNDAILFNLSTVNTVGSISVICSDTAGTLTQNSMSLIAYITSSARYKIDVDSSERSPSNAARDDSFLAERAKRCQHKSSTQISSSVESSSHSTHDSSFYSSERAKGFSEENALKRPGGEVKDDISGYILNKYSSDGSFVRDIFSIGVLCSKGFLGVDGGREGQIGNPTELSIIRAAYFAGCNVEEMKNRYPIVAEVQFSSDYNFMATIHDEGNPNHYAVFAKGEPNCMLNMCAFQAKDGDRGEIEPCNTSYWKEQMEILSSHGFRSVALCRARIAKSCISPGDQLGPDFISARPEGPWLTIVGICAIMDPPKSGCAQAIREAKEAGVRVIMISRDHKVCICVVSPPLSLFSFIFHFTFLFNSII